MNEVIYCFAVKLVKKERTTDEHRWTRIKKRPAIRVHPRPSVVKKSNQRCCGNESLTSYSISVPLHNFCKSSGKERTTDEHRWTRIPPRPDIRVYPRPSVVKKSNQRFRENENLTSCFISVPRHNFCETSGKERTTDERR